MYIAVGQIGHEEAVCLEVNWELDEVPVFISICSTLKV
jgi:hypothetical protein